MKLGGRRSKMDVFMVVYVAAVIVCPRRAVGACLSGPLPDGAINIGEVSRPLIDCAVS
jgi:hypothetical protein